MMYSMEKMNEMSRRLAQTLSGILQGAYDNMTDRTGQPLFRGGLVGMLYTGTVRLSLAPGAKKQWNRCMERILGYWFREEQLVALSDWWGKMNFAGIQSQKWTKDDKQEWEHYFVVRTLFVLLFGPVPGLESLKSELQGLRKETFTTERFLTKQQELYDAEWDYYMSCLRNADFVPQFHEGWTLDEKTEFISWFRKEWEIEPITTKTPSPSPVEELFADAPALTDKPPTPLQGVWAIRQSPEPSALPLSPIQRSLSFDNENDDELPSFHDGSKDDSFCGNWADEMEKNEELPQAEVQEVPPPVVVVPPSNEGMEPKPLWEMDVNEIVSAILADANTINGVIDSLNTSGFSQEKFAMLCCFHQAIGAKQQALLWKGFPPAPYALKELHVGSTTPVPQQTTPTLE
jgi:hypothetical protein